MFGGIDFFRGDAMWGAIMNEADSLRLKVDDTNRAAFEAAGMEPFYMEKMQRSMPYWTVPRAVLADKAQLATWVEQAAAVAARDKKKKK